LDRRSDEPHFLPGAKQDIAEAFAWYEQRSLGLGREYARCLDATIQSIQSHPLMYPAVFADLRRALVRRFPYAVFYEVEPERIVVYAVFHCSQDPDKWKARFLN
jgi:plasmid stabilization system protein ParE